MLSFNGIVEIEIGGVKELECEVRKCFQEI